MSVYRPAGRRVYLINLPVLADGKIRWVQRSTGTMDPGVAGQIDDELAALGPKGLRAWDVLEHLTGPGAQSVSAWWDEWHPLGETAKARLGVWRARQDDIDLEPLVAKWHAGVVQRVAHYTQQHYLAAVRQVIPKGTPFLRSQLTPARLTDWLEGQTVKAAAVRALATGMSSFTRWLKKRGTIAVDPMRDIERPPAGPPRIHYLETPDAQRLADAFESPYREVSALLAGSGIEVSVAVNLRVRDVDRAHREIRAAGTKTYTRDRVVRVAEWAWPYVERAMQGKHLDSRLFPEIESRWAVARQHYLVRAALVEKGFTIYQGYTSRDHRHTYAVRAIRAGTPAELVARQLGHSNAVLVHRVYGRFAPSQQERDRWEQRAAELDREKQKQQDEARGRQETGE